MRTFKVQCPNCKEMVPVYRIGSYVVIDKARAVVVSRGAICPKCNEPMGKGVEE